MLLAVKRLVVRLIRRALHLYVRAQPRDTTGADRRVRILLTSAWGMGGTIRAAYNMGRHLAAHGYDVELISVWRRREEPFFGSFPPGVGATAIDDVRPGAIPPHLRPLRWLLRRFSSTLYHPSDRNFPMWNLWVDVMMVRRLRRGSGFLVSTRPGLNLLVADLDPPGWTTIGLEQMNLGHHTKLLKQAMPKRYPKLDVLVALTDQDVAAYDELLGGRGTLARIPNTVHDISGPRADLDSKTVLAAGRFVYQKGYDLLIAAWAPIAQAHPDWRLKICGHGEKKQDLVQAIADHGVGDVVELAPPAEDLPGEMERSSIYVLSSRFEGFPLVLLEAMGKGMAVVAFDCPTGPRDIVDDHRNGILVPAQDVEGLTRGIMEMIEDAELRRRCGEAATETAREYTIDAVGPRWERLLEDLRVGRPPLRELEPAAA